MKVTKRILLFCPPFSGHFNVLRDLVEADDRFEWEIVITGWTNIPIKLGSLENISTVLAATELHETDPALWTFPRVTQLIDKSLAIARTFKPDLIIYDFFSLEGKFVGDLLGVRVWSSIPAFIGKFNNLAYLAEKLSSTENQSAIQLLYEKYGIQVSHKDLEIVSDGLHLPGELNLIWSYESVIPTNFLAGRHKNPYIFIGSSMELKPKHSLPNPKEKAKKIVYISFGTVVMNNLWNQQVHLRESLRLFIGNLAKQWASEPWAVIFVTQGKDILDTYPDNWTVTETADQIAMLNQADLFVTHGGSNSFHEALIAGVPMLVIPFFGDQPLVAERVAELGIGINLVPKATIDTRSSKAFLNQQLAESLYIAASTIFNDPVYRTAFKFIDLNHANLYKVLS